MSDYLSLENRPVSIHEILIPDLPAKIEYLFGTINPCYKMFYLCALRLSREGH